MKASKTKITRRKIGFSNQCVWIVEGFYPGSLGWHTMGEAHTYPFARKMAALLRKEDCFRITQKKVPGNS